jgi:LacI family transcriptional regulator
MKKERCTAADVARAAGVSMMTVSRAMNGRPGLGPDTRERVMKAAERMGYRPSKAARALASRRSTNLGIVIPDVANPFFAIVAKAAVDVASAAGRNVFIMYTDEDPELELSALDSLIGEDIDGVIVAGSRLPEARLREALSAFDAAVLVNRDCSGAGRGSVNVEDRKGAAEAVAYLAAKGRRRIGLLAGPRTATGTRRRLSGYRDGLELSGLPFDPSFVERCVPTIEGGELATRALVEREPRIDAILAYNDIAAIGALRALEAIGRSVPGDIAVMGTDDVPYAAIVRPALSTVHADIPRLGADAMTLLLALGGEGDVIRVAPQAPRIVIRESA